MRIARACRWIAIALATIAVVDPRLPLPRRERPGLRVMAGPDDDARARLVDRLRASGFPIAPDGESAIILTAGVRDLPPLPSPPVYAMDAGGPDVSIARASASRTRVAGQALAVSVTVRARGARGASTTLRLEDGGLTVASATHRWGADEESWEATVPYLPAGAGPIRLRVRADALPGERRTSDNVADLLGPAVRGPVRVLVIESGVTWPAVFVRRALEAAPGFAVSAVQRTAKTIVTRAGAPPGGLARRDLAPYEVVLAGQPESLDAPALDALRWFVEERGGVAVLVPDRNPAGRFTEMLGGVSFSARTLEAAVALGGHGAGLLAAELAIPHALPPLALALATGDDGAPIVFGVRRGEGAVIVSGALDAWRYRDRNDGAFARFWPSVILQQAVAVPPPVDVTVSLPLARPGDAVHVRARLRGTELPPSTDRLAIPPATARAVSPATHTETMLRLWPAPEPGTYEGEWRPAAPGDYAVDVSIGGAHGAAVVTVAADVAAPIDAGAVAIAARASGGGVVDGEDALVRTLSDRFPARTATGAFNPARSVWYAAAVTLLLCFEWALRRRQGDA